MAFTPPSSIAPSTVTVAGPLAVTGPLTNAELRAAPVDIDGSAVGTPVAVSVAALPLPAGAATADEQARARRALNDIALTAILERGRLDP